jgi:hypothetical protein
MKTMGSDFLKIMKKAHEEGEKRRLAQLASRTPEQIARDEEIRQIQIETHQKRTGTQTPPTQQEATFVTDHKYAVGDTFQSQGGTYTVLEESFYLSMKDVDDAEDGFDVFGLRSGWQTKARLI